MGKPSRERARLARLAAAPVSAPASAQRIRLWDPALRAFHWLLAAAVATSWVLGEFGPSIMTLHFWSGYLVLALLAFRLVWGLVGPAPARFATFLRGPAAVIAYARSLGRRTPSGWPGHNPLGGWAVAALLLVLMAQAGTGLFADPDDYLNIGPLAHLLGPGDRLTMAALHAALSKAVLGLVILHLLAIAFHAVWKRENLVRPMIDGWKTVRRE